MKFDGYNIIYIIRLRGNFSKCPDFFQENIFDSENIFLLLFLIEFKFIQLNYFSNYVCSCKIFKFSFLEK